MANFFAQPEALAFGKTADEVAPRACPSTRSRTAPSPATTRPTSILVPELTPSALGQLIALYEHKVFVQGAIWDINCFDQWGVELGKKLAQAIIPELTAEADPDLGHDSSTNGLIRRYRSLRRSSPLPETVRSRPPGRRFCAPSRGKGQSRGRSCSPNSSTW